MTQKGKRLYSAVLPQVMLTEKQKADLYSLADHFHMSISQVVRDAIDDWIIKENANLIEETEQT